MTTYWVRWGRLALVLSLFACEQQPLNESEGSPPWADSDAAMSTAGSGGGEPDATSPAPDAHAGAGGHDAGRAHDANQPPECERGVTRADQVVMVGDSFFHITEIPQRLWQRARAAGTLNADESYRHYFVSGAMMVPGGPVTPIPTQWETAKQESTDIRFVVMNGGGNDVLIGDRSCLLEAPPTNTACAQTVDNALAAGRTMLEDMGRLGVEQVVFAFYPHMPVTGLFQGYAPAINDTIDYAEARVREMCEELTQPRCTFVSTVEAFEGHPEYLNPGDVHASPAGSEVAAGLIWDAMVRQCVAQ